jgi:hypothetical protein
MGMIDPVKFQVVLNHYRINAAEFERNANDETKNETERKFDALFAKTFSHFVAALEECKQ